ncbi:MAG: 23S rRNA (adenine(2503)-C(2))-methyltransferase RlmN [Candidatus Auribacterota bacterium]|nr:23S rRNA (adenine(2503)-C(2))-methyltransferase RlmN [Candidatus Auribacterota bacterium]
MLNSNKIQSILEKYPAYRLRQAHRAIFRELAVSWDEVTALPKDIRVILQDKSPLTIESEIVAARNGKTAKAIVHLHDGVTIETVLMRHRGGRNTVCVSSQAGCPLGCDFCLTGQRGFTRNLTADEIVEQVLLFARYLQPKDERVRNVVFMGMGEPFLNYSEVMGAIRIMNDSEGLKIGARRISISTIGIVKGIKRLTHEPLQVNLAFSLHAPDNRLRSRLIPQNQQQPIEEILAAISEYIETTRRKVMIEYLLLDGINDSPADAEKLVVLLKKSLTHLYYINLIAYNPTGKYQSPPPSRIAEFQRILEDARVTVTLRYRFGQEINAACGQLAGG